MLPQGLLVLLLLSLSSPSAALPPSVPSFVDQSSSNPHLFSPTSSSDSALYRFTFSSHHAASEARIHFEDSYVADVWKFHRKTLALDVRLPLPVPFGSLWEDVKLQEKPVKTETLIPSIEQHLADQPEPVRSLSSSSSSHRWDFSSKSTAVEYDIHHAYQPYESVVSILRGFAAEFPDFAEVISFGNTTEGREIFGLRVTNSTHMPGEDDSDAREMAEDEDEDFDEEDEDELEIRKVKDESSGKDKKKKKKKGKKGKKPPLNHKLGVVVLAAQHAREWISTSTTLFIIHELLLSTLPDTFSDDHTLDLLKSLSFTFVPVVNVDGYVYSWEKDRFWRKNRQATSPTCFGIDLNRNWGSHWLPGTRPNPCSDSYPGSEAFEAPELLALSAYMADPENHVASFIDFHSYGQMIMYPFSFSCEKTAADEEDQFEAVIGAAKALRSVHGKEFETGSVCGVNLASTGDAIDWAYSKAKLRWSFSFELRDQGVFGFLLPATQIIPSGEETTEAILSLADFVVGREKRIKFSA